MVFAAAAPGLAQAQAIELQVMIPNVRAGAGPIRVELHQDAGAWKSGGKPVRAATATIEGEVAVARFAVPLNRYAVVAWQDRNGNGRLDTLPFGFPTEPLGYSGGDRPWFGRPAWDRADFGLVEGERTTVFVRLK